MCSILDQKIITKEDTTNKQAVNGRCLVIEWRYAASTSIPSQIGTADKWNICIVTNVNTELNLNKIHGKLLKPD